ncbi:hypothetical protein P3X46_028233 [Hevea brasiliensis]|uniref:Uncharacterized protein n=1 Tax=Hevea brasiliensis TaxID=3981 RepID=A0ABQ9KRC4_HEVBR|nr:hypothetical protein P3X46_028233 [Hevea brasiliensis]
MSASNVSYGQSEVVISQDRSEGMTSEAVVLCRHGAKALMHTSWTLGNLGRRFHHCDAWDGKCLFFNTDFVMDIENFSFNVILLFVLILIQGNDYTFFQWYDPPCTGREREVMCLLVRQSNVLKEKVKGLEEMCTHQKMNSTLLSRMLQKMMP